MKYTLFVIIIISMILSECSFCEYIMSDAGSYVNATGAVEWIDVYMHTLCQNIPYAYRYYCEELSTVYTYNFVQNYKKEDYLYTLCKKMGKC